MIDIRNQIYYYYKMKRDVTIPEPEGRCKTCGRMLSPFQNFCKQHKCNQTKKYSISTLTCQKEVTHTGRCLFVYLGETIETGLR